MMNKKLPAILWHMLLEHGMPKDFIKDLLGKSCEASLVAKVYKCTWDEKTRTQTTKEEEEKNKLVKTFESAVWFKDKFGILGKKDQGKKHAPPKKLFNLDGNESYKTIHNHHERPKELVGMPPCTKNNNKKVIIVEDNDKDEASKEEDRKSSESNGSEEGDDKSTRDSASQMSINPNSGDDLSNRRLGSKGSEGMNTHRLDKDATGVTGSGQSTPAVPPHPQGGHSARCQVEKGATVMMILDTIINPGEIAHKVNITEHKLANLGNSKIIGEL